MVAMKRIIARTGSCKKIQRYLEDGGRAEALAVSPSIGDPERWAAEMDAHRMRAGKNAERKWYHFVISPDPADFPTTEDVAELARRWAAENYPDGEWALAVHADNAHEVKHAHVILNAYDPATNGKVQRTNAKIADEWDSLQLLGQEMGMAPLDRLAKKDKRQAEIVYTKAELEMIERGITPYKDVIRRAIDEVAPTCGDFAEFKRELAKRGIQARRTRRGLTYEDARGRAAKDVKLGRAYAISGLEERFLWKSPLSSFVPSTRPVVSPVLPLAPPTFSEALERRARRRGVRDAKALAEILDITARADKPTLALAEKLEGAEKACLQAKENLARAEASVCKLAIAIECINDVRRLKPVGELYKHAGLRRRAFAKEHASELSRLAEAKAWLDARELGGEAARGEVFATFKDADAQLKALSEDVSRADAELARARRLVKTYQEISLPLHVKGPLRPRPLNLNKRLLPAKKQLVLAHNTFADALERADVRAVKQEERERALLLGIDAKARHIATLDERGASIVEHARSSAREAEADQPSRSDSNVKRR